eukprot:Lithocolla_globosa_v1_NODE_3975_length_1539_cov_6.208895.p2 type:complete len:106 gc:universal NODE_3975_length_1539_cov_6.208895:1098-781(-)
MVSSNGIGKAKESTPPNKPISCKTLKKNKCFTWLVFTMCGKIQRPKKRFFLTLLSLLMQLTMFHLFMTECRSFLTRQKKSNYGWSVRTMTTLLKWQRKFYSLTLL